MQCLYKTFGYNWSRFFTSSFLLLLCFCRLSDESIQKFIQVICWKAGVWLPAVINCCYSFLSSAVLLSASYFSFIRSLSRCIVFLPLVAFPLILPSIISCSNDSCLIAHALTRRLHFLIVSNIHTRSINKCNYSVTIFCFLSSSNWLYFQTSCILGHCLLKAPTAWEKKTEQ